VALPSFTIVTPCLNGAATLREALDSVREQAYPAEIEHVVVDGGSTDGTLEILEEQQQAAGEARLRYLSEPDRGLSDAVNKGIRMARGDVIGWLNADDVYQPIAEVEADERPVSAEHDGWHQPEVAVEPEPEPELVLVESIPDEPIGEPPVASLPEPVVAERPHADLGSLSAAVETAVESLESFVKNELHNLREVSALEIDDILAERQRLSEDATKVGRRHIDEASAHAEKIVNKARKEGDRMRQQVEQELREERERFEQSLADRDAQAQARVTEILEQAEARRHEADELVASAAQAQASMLASFEQARSSLIQAAERNRISSTQVQAVSSDEDADEHDTSAAA